MTATDELRAATARVVEAAARSVVRIGRHGGRGCGVVVGEGLVLTNAHNLRDRTTQVTFADGRAEQGRAAGIDLDGDLTVLQVDTGDAPVLAWAVDADGLAVDWGTTVFAVARTGDGVRVTSGVVSGVDRTFRGPRGRLVSGGVEHTAPLARGSSGSPIVDEQGRLLGVTTLRLGDGFAIARLADADLRTRVDDLAVGEEPRRRLLGVGIAPAHVARRMRQAVGLPERDGVLVREVEAGSPADRAGLRRGDLLAAAGDTVITDADVLFTVLAAVPEGGELVLHVVRGTDDLDVTVHFDDAADAAADESVVTGDEGDSTTEDPGQ
ncbi:MAG TPA: trypsin-like peptidase domain-containing protein [Acidimicrobiales bacterium]|nr:trypsin-like peptidase domain-containing protein [Acidimicrobiales bacterium]